MLAAPYSLRLARYVTNIDHAVETTRRTARGEQGQISVGVTPTGPFYPFVPRVIRAFREAYPGVSLTLEESPSPELVDRLRDEQIDAAFLRTPIAGAEGLRIDPLLEEPMVVALPNGHVLAQSHRGRDTALSVRDLAGETFIVYGRPHKPGQHGLGQYEAMIAACHAAGFSPRIGQEAPRISSTLSLVAVGLGITSHSGFTCTNEYGWCRISSAEGHQSAQGHSAPRIAPRRPFGSGSTLLELGQANSEEFCRGLRNCLPLNAVPTSGSGHKRKSSE